MHMILTLLLSAVLFGMVREFHMPRRRRRTSELRRSAKNFYGRMHPGGAVRAVVDGGQPRAGEVASRGRDLEGRYAEAEQLYKRLPRRTSMSSWAFRLPGAIAVA